MMNELIHFPISTASVVIIFRISMVLTDSRYVSIEKCEYSNPQRFVIENCGFDENGMNFTYQVKVGTNVTNVGFKI